MYNETVGVLGFWGIIVDFYLHLFIIGKMIYMDAVEWLIIFNVLLVFIMNVDGPRRHLRVTVGGATGVARGASGRIGEAWLR